MALENSTLPIDEEKLLEELGDKMAIKMIPVMAYLLIMMVLGIIGNAGVFFFYRWKARSSPGSLFIRTLSIYDFLLCLLSAPIEIVDIRFFFTFNDAVACKFMTFFNCFATTGSVFTLLVIALDRYRRICTPFKKQIGNREANIACGLSFVAGIIFSGAAFFIFNAEPVDVTTDEGVILRGHDCTTRRNDAYKIYIWVGICSYGLGVIITAVVLFVLYGLVGKTLYRHVQKTKHYNKPTSEFHDEEDRQDTYKNTGENTENTTNIEMNEKSIVSQTNKSQAEGNISVRRFTCMMLVISVVFFLSFIPFICFAIWRGTLKEHVGGNFTSAEEIGINIGLRSFFINSAVNPFIYGFFNPNFRRFCYAKMCICFKKHLTETQGNSFNGSGTQTSEL